MTEKKPFLNPVHDRQERALLAEEICKDILVNARNELYLNMRFLDTALSALGFAGDMGLHPLGTDGRILYYHPEDLMHMYRKSREMVNRAYLHSLLHCMFLHAFPEDAGADRNPVTHSTGNDSSTGNSGDSWTIRHKLDHPYWDLACDVAAETIIDGLYLKCVHHPPSATRRYARDLLLEDGKVMTAQRIYRKLCQLHLPEPKYQELCREFRVDDHRKWYETPPNNPNTIRQRQNWEDIRNKMQTEIETFSKEAAKDSKSLTDHLQAENRHRYDYRDFLRKFSVLKEEMKVDMDTFDYIYYNYGMNMYGNMPLIEPLETKEERKVEDFVIVIDTSMSCKGELVQKFLEETYSVLSETESFSRRIHIHIIQCDDRVQSDVVIENREALRKYMENFTVIGEGGTDFRPPFIYVEKLMLEKRFTKLRGMIYFTDGYGTFPAKMPPYETAFVFMKEDYQDIDVPPWAIKLILGEEDLAEQDLAEQ